MTRQDEGNSETVFQANHSKQGTAKPLSHEGVMSPSHDLLKQVIDFLPDATFVIDSRGVVIAWNKAMELLTNVPAQEMIGKGDLAYSLAFYPTKRPVLIDLVNNPDPAILSKYKFVRRQGDKLISETPPNTHLYGDTCYLNVACPLYDEKGEIVGAIECIRDITDQRKSEQALKESESKYHKLFEMANDAIFLIEGSIIVECNAKALEMFSCQKGQLIGRSPHELSPVLQPDGVTSREKADKSIEDALKGKAQFFEWRHRRDDGSLFDTEVSLSSFDSFGKRYIMAVVRDISERKRAEEALAGNAKFLNDIMESIQDGISILEPDLTIRHVNSTMRNWYADRLPLTGKKCFTAYHNAQSPCQPCPTLRCIATGRPEKDVVPGYPGSEVKWLEVSSYPIREVDTHRISGVVEFVRNVTDRVLAEEALRESEERLRLTFLASPDSVSLSRLEDGLYIDINEGFERVTGYRREEVIGKTSNELNYWHDPEDRQRLITELKTKGFCENREVTLRRKDGALRSFLISARVFNLRGEAHILSINRDITEIREAEEEKKKLEKQLANAQRLESIGRLAGGIAHDFNNMLGVILGRADMALARLERDNPLQKDISEIQKAAHKSAELTKQLLGFARRQVSEPKVLDINETIESMLNVLKRLIGEDIELSWTPGLNIMPVKMDPTQIDQILVNLCVNARDAIADVGRITIETSNHTVTEEYCKKNYSIMPGEYVTISVTDTGCGMEKDVLDKIFEPFFSTKEIGKGTGLGLSTVYGIVKQNEGYINVYSEPGQGTTFRIYLKSCKVKKLEDHVCEREEHPKGGNETILLVEDEPMLLELGTQALITLGYNVLSALGPIQALEIAQSYNGKIHLIITDVVMPVMNGKQLVERISYIRPAMKCLFTSGYTANVIAERGILKEGINFIQKPLTPKTLYKKIREILD